MIELIYNEEEKYTAEERSLAVPKNVRQMGEPKDYKKIFIEDYVHTFLLQYSVAQDVKTRIAILLGKSEYSGGKRHLYVKSALPVEDVCEKQGKYVFSEKLWGDIYLQCEQYFPEQEIIGWFLARPGVAVEKTAVTEETHRTYFSGADKLLFMTEPLDGECGFFAFDGNRFTKQPGYYIYYEKNNPMHEFLLEKNSAENDEKSKEQPDVAVANFRKLLQDKQAKKAKRKKMAISYGMKVTIALVLFVGAVTLKNQTEKIRRMEQLMNSYQEQKPEKVVEVSSGEVVVDTLPGEVQEQQMTVPEEPVAEEIVEELPVTEADEEAPAEPEVRAEVVEEAPAPQHYTVQEGDTLAKISRDRYGSDDMVDAICALNSLNDGDYIQVGETILLP